MILLVPDVVPVRESQKAFKEKMKKKSSIDDTPLEHYQNFYLEMRFGSPNSKKLGGGGLF